MAFVDFKKVKEPCHYRADARFARTSNQTGQQLRATCPACKEDGDRAIVITPEKGLFYCFPVKSEADVQAQTLIYLLENNLIERNSLANQE